MGWKRNAYRILVIEQGGKILLGREANHTENDLKGT
jgi:hypothetical protein